MDASPFRRLPEKVRKKIWEMVLCPSGETPLPAVIKRSTFNQLLKRKITTVALLLVCRDIGKEALIVFYSNSEFVFAPRPFDGVCDEGGVVGKEGGDKGNSEKVFHPLHHPSRQQQQQQQQDWSEQLAEWLTAIGPANRSLVRNLTIALGSWGLHVPAEHELEVAWTLHRIGKLFATNATDCALLLTTTVPTVTTTLPCQIDLRIRLKDLDEGLELVDKTFQGGLQALDHLWRARKVNFARYSALSKDIRECSGRLTGFVKEIGMGDADDMAPASVSDGSNGDEEEMVATPPPAYARIAVDMKPVQHAEATDPSVSADGDLGVVIEDDGKIQQREAEFVPEQWTSMAAISSHLRKSRYRYTIEEEGLPDSLPEFEDFIDLQYVPTPLIPRRNPSLQSETQSQAPSQAPSQTTDSPTPSSPTIRHVTGPASPSFESDVDFEQELEELVGSQFQARWNKRLEYFYKDRQNRMMAGETGTDASSLYSTPAPGNDVADSKDWAVRANVVECVGETDDGFSYQNKSGTQTEEASPASYTASKPSQPTSHQTQYPPASQDWFYQKADNPDTRVAPPTSSPQEFIPTRNVDIRGQVASSNDGHSPHPIRSPQFSLDHYSNKPLPQPGPRDLDDDFPEDLPPVKARSARPLPPAKTFPLPYGGQRMRSPVDRVEHRPIASPAEADAATGIRAEPSGQHWPTLPNRASSLPVADSSTSAQKSMKATKMSPNIADQLEQLKTSSRAAPRDVHPALRQPDRGNGVGLGINKSIQNSGNARSQQYWTGLDRIHNVDTHDFASRKYGNARPAPSPVPSHPQSGSKIPHHNRPMPQQPSSRGIKTATEDEDENPYKLTTRSNPASPITTSPGLEFPRIAPQPPSVPGKQPVGHSPLVQTPPFIQRRSSSFSKRSSKSSTHADRHSIADNTALTNSGGTGGKKKWNVFSSLKESAMEAYRRDMREVFGEEVGEDGKSKGAYIAARPTGMM